MSIQNQNSYYEKHTIKYKNLIEKGADFIISKGNNRSTFCLDPKDLDELSIDIIENLKRITYEIDNKKPIRDEDIISTTDDITIIKLKIQENIMDEISEKGFKVSCKDEIIKISKYK
ncbi:hypothetical protein [Clostridium sp. ZS1]|uniref:hypothetical protein n=1 Tax=Clostridium sp. ZS1 TaxID=2949989 RepID=UPI0020792D32|nr:hypothetical protein [Clostridium sp. ZS1]